MEAHTDGTERVSTAALVRDLSAQTTRLVRDELELARAELTAKGRRAGIGAGMLGGAGVIGLYALGALAAAAILLLSRAMTAWVAALLVAGVLALTAAVVALIARASLKASAPPVPQETVETIRQDITVIREHAHAARD